MLDCHDVSYLSSFLCVAHHMTDEMPATLMEKPQEETQLEVVSGEAEPMQREDTTVAVPEPTPTTRPLEPSPPKEQGQEVEMFTLTYPIRKQQIHLRDAEGRIIVGEKRTLQANNIIAEWFVNEFLQNTVASAVMKRIIMRDFPDEFAAFKMPLEHEMELLDGISEVCNGRVEEIEDLLDKDDQMSYEPSSQEGESEKTASEPPSSQERQQVTRRRKELRSEEHREKMKEYKTAVNHYHRQNPTLGTRIGRPPAKRGRD